MLVGINIFVPTKIQLIKINTTLTRQDKYGTENIFSIWKYHNLGIKLSGKVKL